MRQHDVDHITMEHIDWAGYLDIEILYLLKKYLAKQCSSGMFTDFNFEYLKGVFGENGTIILKYISLLESVTHPTYEDVYKAHKQILGDMARIPKCYHHCMLFDFDEWQGMTSFYYGRKKELRKASSSVTGSDAVDLSSLYMTESEVISVSSSFNEDSNDEYGFSLSELEDAFYPDAEADEDLCDECVVEDDSDALLASLFNAS